MPPRCLEWVATNALTWGSQTGPFLRPGLITFERRAQPQSRMILVANSAFASCSHGIRLESGWIGDLRGRIARFCLPWSAQRRIRHQYQGWPQATAPSAARSVLEGGEHDAMIGPAGPRRACLRVVRSPVASLLPTPNSAEPI
jgi:hypothetical protein